MPLAEAVPLVLAGVVLLLAVRLTYLDYRLRKGRKQLSGFNAATVVEDLDWTFEPFVQAKGKIKEPNDDQINGFLKDFKAIVAEVRAKVPTVAEDADPVDLMSALDDMDLDSVDELTGKLAGLYAALCSGEPSRETILALPPRRRAMFYGWLQQEVMNPEAAPAAGNAQVKNLRSVAGG